MSENIENNETLKKEKQMLSSRENLTAMLPFVFFVAFILLLYIYFSHQTDKKIRKIEKLNKEVKELYSENITLQTEILNKTRSSSLEPLMLNYGIKPPVKQPILIK